MLQVHKYHNLSEIDPEFIPGLEKLLGDDTPSFSYLKELENELPEEIYFNYYLFFGPKTNEPIGFFKIELHPIEDRTTSKKFFSFMNKNKNDDEKLKNIFGQTNLHSKHCLYFNPYYINDGLRKVEELLKELKNREDIINIELILNSNSKDILGNTSEESIIPLGLLKNTKDYQTRLQALPQETQQTIKRSWIEANKEYTIAEFDSLKEVFSYRPDGIVFYNALKKDSNLKKIEGLNQTFVTLEKDGEVYALIYLIKGAQNNYFYNQLDIKGVSNPILLTELAVMKFYEVDGGKMLMPLSFHHDNKIYEELGFLLRRNYSKKL